MKKPQVDQRSGFVLVTVLMLTVVVTLLVIGSSFTALADLRVASSQRGGTEAYYVAQAGMERLKTGLFLGLEPIFGSDAVSVCDAGDGPIVIGIGGNSFITENSWLTAIDYGPGQYDLLFTRDDNRFILTSIGRVNANQSTIQVVATAGGGAAGVWDNAVYAREFRDSQGNRTITGNVAAFGSVHIVNGDLSVDRFRDEALDLSGTAGVFNNYYGDANGTATDVRDQVDKAIGVSRRSLVLDLCSQIKIAKGDIVLSGSSSIGADPEGAPEGGYENQIEGIYLGPNQTVSGGSVFSRNNVSGYDGFNLPFPPLADNFPNDLDAQRQSIITTSNCTLIRSGSLSLPPTDPTTSVTCPANPVAGQPYLRWNGNANPDLATLEVVGTVAVPNDNIDIVSDVTYSGTGVLRAGNSGNSSIGVNISGQVLPANPAAYLGTDSDAIGLGIVSNGPITLGGSPGSKPTIAAMIYSEDLINVQQTYTVVGSLVGDGVFTDNVPFIAYHPGVGVMAEFLCLPGTVCDNEGVFGNQGFFQDISVERR